MSRSASLVARRRVSVVGCAIDALTLGETLAEVERLIGAHNPVQHCVVNASKAVLMDRDPVLRDIVSSCALVNADGQSIVWASRLLGRPLPGRVAGIDLFEALLDLAARRGFGVYFLGATETVLASVVTRAGSEYPSLRLCGNRNGYWDAADECRIVAQVRAAKPDILFVGIPSPRKEYWLAKHVEEMGVPFSMGVGGSFDVYAGLVRRAPPVLQRMGLEWAYRFMQEPARMWRRYLFGNLAFVLLVGRYFFRDAASRFGGRRPPRGGVRA